MMKKFMCLWCVFAFVTITLDAQTDNEMKTQGLSFSDNRTDSVSSRHSNVFDTGHIILAYIMRERPDTPRLFDPQMPAFWLGNMTLCDGFMGHKPDGVPFKDGFFRQNEAGFTLIQLSKGLSHDVFGVTTALQVTLGTIGLDRNYEAIRENGKICFVDTKEALKSSVINYTSIRVPVLLGIQDRRHRFSLLSGVALDFCIPGRDLYYYCHQDEDKSHHRRIHANCFSANWQVMAGIGPLTIGYSQSIFPLFKLSDGSGIYTNSLSIGLDLWYLIR